MSEWIRICDVCGKEGASVLADYVYAMCEDCFDEYKRRVEEARDKVGHEMVKTKKGEAKNE